MSIKRRSHEATIRPIHLLLHLYTQLGLLSPSTWRGYSLSVPGLKRETLVLGHLGMAFLRVTGRLGGRPGR